MDELETAWAKLTFAEKAGTLVGMAVHALIYTGLFLMLIDWLHS